MPRSSLLLGPAILLTFAAVIAQTPRGHGTADPVGMGPAGMRPATRANDCQLQLGDSLGLERLDDGVRLRWAEQPGVLEYEIQRCDASNGPCTPAFLASTAEPEYVDTTAVFDHYWYRVVVLDAPCPWPGSFCKTPMGTCGGPGVCTVRPPTCPDVWIPVCGCDGMTYSNECYSDLAAVSVFWLAPCR